MLLTALAVSSAVVTIAADGLYRRHAFYVAKPLTTVLILASAASAWSDGGSEARWIIGGGMLCLLGDVLLMRHGDRWFAAGLAAFLLAHLLFIAGLREGGPFDPPTWSLAVATSGIVAAGVVAQRAGRLHIAVAIYAAALLGMFVSAAARDAAFASSAAREAIIGAGLFVISDAVLGWRRFVQPFPGAQALTLATYYPALWLIVQSAVSPLPSP
jgi:uncharacterized membrane protein YhhN